MPPRRSSGKVSSAARPLQNLGSTNNSRREAACVEQESQGDMDGDADAAAPSSPAIRLPASSPASSPTIWLLASGPNHDQPVSTFTAPSNQHFLIQDYRNGDYTDLNIHCGYKMFPVHRIIVCSESPVLKAMCGNLAPGQPLVLNQYNAIALERVLEFCYCRTCSDGEYAKTMAPFLIDQTANDVRDALVNPVAVLSDIEDPGWVAECTGCDDSGSSENQDEYIPDSCNIHCPLDYDSHSSDDEMTSNDIPSRPQSPMEISSPPYLIRFFEHFEVYVTAKELQIPALQLVARERFAHNLRTHWRRCSYLPALIRRVYSKTDPSDPLRGLICQMVAADYGSEFDLAFKAEIRELMLRNDEFAAEVLDMVIRLRTRWEDTCLE